MRTSSCASRTQFVVGVDVVNFLAATSLILLQRDCGMKWPGPTLHVRLRETGSTDLHALVAYGG